jgi:hypothetical protein
LPGGDVDVGEVRAPFRCGRESRHERIHGHIMPGKRRNESSA